MRDEIPVKLRLTVPIVADRIVEIYQAFPGHQFAKAAYQLVGAARVNAKIRAGIRE